MTLRDLRFLSFHPARGLRAWIGAAATLLLAGCLETTPLQQAATRGLQPANGPQTIRVIADSMTVSGPAGYCVDIEATQDSGVEAFVLLVRCRGTLRPAPVLSAAITGTPAPDSSDPSQLRRLTDFLATPPGRAQLSRSGDPHDVTVHRATYSDGAIWLLIEDRGNPDSFDNLYWRAILPVSGRIVTLSVLASADHPFDEAAGLALLTRFVMRIRSANQR